MEKIKNVLDSIKNNNNFTIIFLCSGTCENEKIWLDWFFQQKPEIKIKKIILLDLFYDSESEINKAKDNLNLDGNINLKFLKSFDDLLKENVSIDLIVSIGFQICKTYHEYKIDELTDEIYYNNLNNDWILFEGLSKKFPDNMWIDYDSNKFYQGKNDIDNIEFELHNSKEKFHTIAFKNRIIYLQRPYTNIFKSFQSKS